MKYILTEEELQIPEGVDVDFKAREITVKGKRGTLKRAFKHVPFSIQKVTDEKSKIRKLKLQIWMSKRKQKTCVTSVTSQIRNMMNGVTKGYRYKMRFAYAHFPINYLISNNGRTIEIKNFLGEKIIRKINMLEGVKITRKEEIKDELIIEGNDLNNVSLSCGQIHQSCLVKDKDIRKFLDGCYVFERGFQEE